MVLYSTPHFYVLHFLLLSLLTSRLGWVVCSAAESNVIACAETDAVSVLPAGPSRDTMTQHGRAAVGLGPSVIHNVSGKTNSFVFVYVVYFFSIFPLSVFPLLTSWFRLHYCEKLWFVLSWPGVCPSWFTRSDVCRTCVLY